VSVQLGHASSAFTLDVYSHVLQRMRTEAALREALLGMDGRAVSKKQFGPQGGRLMWVHPLGESWNSIR
jgi:hypothetical protein